VILVRVYTDYRAILINSIILLIELIVFACEMG